MSRTRDRLTAIAIKNLSTPGYHHDGGGLYLQVSKYGTKSWVLRYSIDKKARNMGLGPQANWTLAEARERAKLYRQLIDQKIDPIVHRDAELEQRKARDAEAAMNRRTFAECAYELHEAKRPDWTNSKQIQQWINTLTTYAFPHFGELPISQLTREHIRVALLPIWREKAETASRVLGRIHNVVTYAASRGYCTGLDSEQWTQLKESLPNNSKQRRIRHHDSCPHDQVAAVLRTVHAGRYTEMMKSAFDFIIHTAARSGEARNAVWEEINFKTRCWIIPAERMKAGRQHMVPLSDAAWAVLEQLRSAHSNPEAPKGLIFPSARGEPLSDMTFTQAIRRLDLTYTMHGFRASFRTWGAEIAHYESDLLETALAHIVGDKTMRAYQRSDMVEKRRKLMQDWAHYLRSTAHVDLISPGETESSS